MAELRHMIHEHPLVYNEDTGSPSDITYDCAACAEEVLGSSYSCGECGFYLHKKCAEAPLEINHPAHRDHPLLPLPASVHQDAEDYCDICCKEVKGLSYHCYSCGFYLHYNCTLLPRDTARNLIEIIHFAHPHPLVSIYPVTYIKCGACLDQNQIINASYGCFDCGSFFHKKCLELPTEIFHPCHRKHQLLLDNCDGAEPSVCNLCPSKITWGFYYRCDPCKVYFHFLCAWPPPSIEDKSHHLHPFTLLLRPNNPFYCSACGNQGNHVSYICSTCNIQVHRDCISLPHHIKHTLHPHSISHNFFLRIDPNDSRTWDCRICYKKVNNECGSYCCSRAGCDFVIHIKCSIENRDLFGVAEVENTDEFDETDWFADESMSCIIRVIKEIKIGDDVIAAEILHLSHEHNLIFSDEIEDKRYCNGCMLPVLSSFYYCLHCNFFLHKACANLPKMYRPWFAPKPLTLLTNGVFACRFCCYECSGFSYNPDVARDFSICVTCALLPYSCMYEADKPHFLLFDDMLAGQCDACGKYLGHRDTSFRCKDCALTLDKRCVTLPGTAWHKCDQHSLTLTYQDPDDYELRHYCDICEEERVPERWFYHCETCDNAMHIKCVLGKTPFIKAGSKYTYKDHPHPLTFVNNIYYYPECVRCREPCQDLALECEEHGCKYIVHWSCIRPYHAYGEWWMA